MELSQDEIELNDKRTVQDAIAQSKRNMKDIQDTMFAISQRARKSIQHRFSVDHVDGLISEEIIKEFSYFQKQLANRDQDLERERVRVNELQSLVKKLQEENQKLNRTDEGTSLQGITEEDHAEAVASSESEPEEEELVEKGPKSSRRVVFVEETKKILNRFPVVPALKLVERSASVDSIEFDPTQRNEEDMFDLLRKFEKETGVETFIFQPPPETERPVLSKTDSFKEELDAFLALEENEPGTDLEREESISSLASEEVSQVDEDGVEDQISLDDASELWDKFSEEHKLDRDGFKKLISHLTRKHALSKAALTEIQCVIESLETYVMRGYVLFEDYVKAMCRIEATGLDELKWRFDTFPLIRGRVPLILFKSALEDAGCLPEVTKLVLKNVDKAQDNHVSFSEYCQAAQSPSLRKIRIEPYERIRVWHDSSSSIVSELKPQSSSTAAMQRALNGGYSADKLASKIVVKKKKDSLTDPVPLMVSPAPPRSSSLKGNNLADRMYPRTPSSKSFGATPTLSKATPGVSRSAPGLGQMAPAPKARSVRFDSKKK